MSKILDFDVPGFPGMTEQQKMAAIVIGGVVLYSLAARGNVPPKWAKDCPPVNPRTNGAWRGKGSFGHAPFGTQVSHRR